MENEKVTRETLEKPLLIYQLGIVGKILLDDRTKICKICETEKSNSEFHKQTKGLYGTRSKCKVCLSAEMKIIRNSDSYRETNKLRQRAYRKKNPDKNLEICRKYYHKNKDSLNEVRRTRYATDPDFRQKKILQEIQYKATGRRLELRQLPENREKCKIKSKLYKKNNSEKVKKYSENYRKENHDFMLSLYKRRRETLTDGYILGQLIKNRPFLSKEDIDKDMIEMKRLLILIKRKVKNGNTRQDSDRNQQCE